jgi:hypothetical protein
MLFAEKIAGLQAVEKKGTVTSSSTYGSTYHLTDHTTETGTDQ